MSVLITPERLSEILGMSQHALAIWRMKGKGPRYVKLGKSVRYREEDVQRWLEKQAVEAASA